MIAAWPKMIFSRDIGAEKEQEKLRKIVSEIRNIRILKGVKPGEVLEVVFRAPAPDVTFLQTHATVLCFLGKIVEIRFTDSPMDSAKYSFGVIDGIEIYVDTSSGLDVESEKTRLRLQIEDKKEYIRILDEKLLNKEFLKNAPEGLIRSQQEKKHQAEEQLVKLEEKYAAL
jgi:valyl-tRNA synthetase